MKWLLKRLLLVCLIMGVFCAAAIFVGRLDHSRSKLQTLGLDICDGDPCYRGIRPGASLATVQKMFPNAVMGYDGLQMNNFGGLASIAFHPSTDNTTIDSINLLSFEFDPPQPFTLADVILQYGVPCHVMMYYGDTGPYFLDIIYPKMSLSVETQSNSVTGELYDSHRLKWNYPVKGFSIGQPSQGGCNETISEGVSRWYGFRTEEDYHRNALHDLDVTQP